MGVQGLCNGRVSVRPSVCLVDSRQLSIHMRPATTQPGRRRCQVSNRSISAGARAAAAGMDSDVESRGTRLSTFLLFGCVHSRKRKASVSPFVRHSVCQSGGDDKTQAWENRRVSWVLKPEKPRRSVRNVSQSTGESINQSVMNF